MRRVDSEGDMQGRRDRKRVVARAGSTSSRSRLRRVSLEILEGRELLSTLPSPVATQQSLVGFSDSGQGNSSSPSVAVDPVDPNKLIAAWTTNDPTHKPDGTNGQVTTYAQAAYSTNGGQTWTSLLSGSSAVNLQDDFSVAPPTNAPQPHFAQTTDASVAIGPDETAYLLTSSHTGASGVLDLQRWDFTGNAPVARAFTPNTFDTTFGSTLLNPIYRWQGGDQAVTPSLAVDTSVVDPTVANSARYAGNVYVAWQTIDTAPQNVTSFNPQAIKLVASSDGGQDFTYQDYLNGGTFASHNSGNLYTSPRLAVSAGGGGVTPGQVTVVYDNAGPGAAPSPAPFFDRISTQTVTGGSAVARFGTPGGPISNSGTLATSFTFSVNINDPKFTSLQDLSLSLSLSYPVLGDTLAFLTAPDGTQVRLWNNATDAAGAATNLPGTITGANMGASAEHGTGTNALYYIGTTLDSTAYRPLSGDTTVAAPYTGRFRPFQNLSSSFLGRSPAGLNGTWTLTITPSRVQTVTPPAAPLALVGASLDFTSGLVANPAQAVGTSFLNSGASAFTDGVQGVPVFANPVIASDNTMGADGAHKGRLYIAYTNDDYATNPAAYTDSTFISLYFSDNGGASWTPSGIVNDDDGLTDGFSTGGYSQPNLAGTNTLGFSSPKANVRPKLDPQVAVDQSTGTLVVSFLDTRHDASRTRVATYVAASDDGGQTFAPETYANASQFAVDAITGQAVNLGPIPDNQSAANNNREATFGYGQRQGLAVTNGRIIPVWSSNQNGGSNLRNNQKAYLDIESAVMTLAAGPRVIASTQGPVGEPGSAINQRRAADGSPIAETIVLTFDRPVDPNSFPSDGGNAIGTSPIQVFYNNPSGTAAPVPLRVLSVTAGAGNTAFTVAFDPAGHGIGTYTYTLRPTVRGLNPFPTSPTTTATGTLLDQNADGVPGGPGDAYAVGTGPGQLPLIVPGPHVASTTVVDTANNPATGADNLINNGSVDAIGVTFDRDIRVDSFTPDQVLSITGPIGPIGGPQKFASTGTSKAYPFNGAARAIPKAAAAGGTPTNLTTVIPISGTNLKVSSLTVRVNITDPNDASLSLTLKAPDGTPVPLVLAGAASGANFTETTFSDSPPANGLPATPIAPGQAPYGLTYQPAMPLSALAGKALDGNWSLIVADGTTGGAAGRLNSWSLGVTPLVPEGAGTLLDSTLTIPYADDSFKIAHLAVQLNLTAAQDSDLQVDLISPTGADVPLFANVGGTGKNFTNTTFDQSATIPIASGVAPFALTYRPAGDLGTVVGQSIRGTWTLRVRDANANGLTATLNSWSLIATPQITVTPVSPSNGAARSFAIGFPTQRLSGNYTATLGTGIRSVAVDPSNPGVGAAVDTDLNAGVDALKGVSNGVTTPSTYAATAVPVAIPVGPGSTLTSQINVPDGFTVQGDAVGGPAGLVVRLDISYPNDPDLTVKLTSPSGHTITLFSGVGNGSVTANFTNTVLSDVTSPLAPITSAPAPFFGTFNPTTPLASFAGEPSSVANGNGWTLTITNGGGTAATGTLNSWSLTFQRPQPGTGLGEPVADQKTVGFRLFNIAPTDPLSNNSWTAVGPAGILAPNTTKLSGPVSVVAFDPSDPSRNTAFVGASSGGVWKTNDFLTTDPSGPTYVPVTDFGPNYSLNIGGIAVFGRNGDPGQSIVFAGTGDGQTSYGAGGNATRGVGILRSLDGGRNWTLLDSTVNVDASGNPLPINSPMRDHALVGTTTYKVVVDPTPAAGGGVIVYAALGGPDGGLWRSVDGGGHWQLLSASIQAGGQDAAATDVILDPASVSSSTGNLDILYAAFQGVGVYISGNRGQSLSLLAGTNGATNLIQNSQFLPSPPLRVNNINTPNGAFGRIVLAKPALTDNAAQNILYQDWLYAAVENTDGTFRGLFETKDRGENWTKVSLASVPTPANSSAVTQALPTNDNTQANNYDVTNGATSRVHNGNYAFSLTVDPSNPDVVYLGGTTDYQTSGLIRVDLTGIYDAHAFVPFANDRNDGGALRRDATGRVDVNAVNFPDPFYQGSFGGFDPNYYVNLRHSPTNPFDLNSTLFVYNSNGFTNDGTGVAWTPIDQLYGAPLGGSTNIHQLLSVVDPLTGQTRLVVADDQGVFTAVYDASGVLSTGGIGTAASVNGSRNGNLQDAQLYYGAAQPSSLAAQTAGALFYGSGIGTTNAQSDSNLLSDGNLTWVGKGAQYGNIQNTINSYDRIGSGIATDPTGGTTVSNPIGTGPSSYEYDQPFLGGDTTNFFRVNQAGQTTGLVNNYQADFPGVTPVYNGVTPLGNFAVNPINGSQILISTARGDLYETTNKGVQWLRIGTGAGDFDGTYAPAVAYGAPDPNAPNGLGNLNNFIYAGTVGGHVYLTRSGGGPWASISAGLDGSSVVAIYTKPDRGSHEAYAVTLRGVYYMADSVASPTNPTPTWANITGNLSQIQHDPFNDPTLGEADSAGFNAASGALGGFRSIVADYRYSIPDASNNGQFHPVLYVAGYGGVFRSLDNGQTWSAFPNTSFDSAPADGGYLPNVEVTSLTLNLGAINPATGHAGQVTGDPEVLLASTFGRGEFAIRLAPDVFPTTVGLDPTLPTPGGSATGTLNGNPLTNMVHPFIAGTSEVSNFGNAVTITLIDEATGLVIGTGTTDTFGHFSVQVGSLANDPSFGLDGVKTVGVQATDTSGAKGNVTLFTYALKTTVPPPAPTGLTLDPSTNTGLNPAANITNSTHPLFDVAGLLPNDYLELFRSIGGSTPVLVGTAAVGSAQVRDTAGVPADGVYLYRAAQVSVVGDVSNFSPAIAVTINTTVPPAPTIMLVDSDDSGLPSHPDVTNVRSPHFSGTAAYNAGTNFPLDILAVTNGNNAGGIVQARTFPSANGTYLAQILGPIADGTYTLVARTTNLAGTHSYSAPLTITIKASGPTIKPTLSILPADDTGIKGDGVTANHTPRFTGVADKGATVNLYAVINGRLSGVEATAIASTVNGSFTFSLPFNLTNGTTQLVAQAVDIANNKGPLGDPFNVRIVTVAGDYYDTGAAQLTIFNPQSQTYTVRNAGTVQVDRTVGRDVPVQYDYNGDGKTDLVAYRYNTAEYAGTLSNGSPLLQQFGPGGSALPVSATYGTTGTFIYGNYNPYNTTWTLALPQSGGEVVKFGVPNVDVPTPAAFDGGGVAEIAYFRPSSTVATDQDSFTVATSVVNNQVVAAYRVSFTNSALARFGFVYKPGDLPAPADYDGIGQDEFAIYRPSTGQFFILRTPNVNSPTTWTIRTVSLNLPGGPNVNDVPASQDYDGNGKVDPTAYRPSNSTFYVVHSSTGIQENFQFGTPGGVVAAAGPLLYRLTALKGAYATTGGYKAAATAGAVTTGAVVHARAIASASSTSTSSSAPVPSLVAVASPMVLTTTTATPAPASASTASSTKYQVVVGASTPRAFIPVVAPSKPEATPAVKLAKAKKPAKALVVDSAPQAAPSAAKALGAKAPAAPAGPHPAVALAMRKVVNARKGGHQG